MEEIEYLEEYEDLILPTIQSNSGEVDGFQTSRNSNMMQDEDSSSIDQDIFESLFDDHSDDESSNILQKKADPKLSQRGSDDRASLDSLDMLVKDLVGEQNSQKKSSQSTKTNTNTSITTSKAPSQFQKKMSTSTPSSSSAIGRSNMQKAPTSSSSSSSLLKNRPSGGSLTKLPIPRSSLGYQKRPGSNVSDTSAMMSSSSQKQKPTLSHGSRMDMQHKFDKSKSVATVRPTVQQKQQQHQHQQRRFPPSALNRNPQSSAASSSRSSSGLVTLSARKNMSMPSNRGGPSPRGGPTTRGGIAPRQLQRPQTTIIKPEKREIKDPSEDPLSLDDIAEALLDSDSDSFSLSDISDESMDSMSDLEEDSHNVIDISNDSSIDTKNNHKDLENIRRDTPSPTVSDVEKDDDSLTSPQSKSKSNDVEISKHPNKPDGKPHEAKEGVASLIVDDITVVPKKPAPEKVTIISDTLLTRIDSALLDTALMDKKNPTDNEYCNQTNEDVVAALERELMPFLKKKTSTDCVEEEVVPKVNEGSNIQTDTTNPKNILDELAEAVFGMDNDIEDKSNENLDKRHTQLNSADSDRRNSEAEVLNSATEKTDNLNKENIPVQADQSIESNTVEEVEDSTINESNDIIEESPTEYDDFNDQLDNEVAMEVEVETIKDAETENVDANFDMELNNTGELATNEQQSQDHKAEDEGTIEENDQGFVELKLPTTETSENVMFAQTVPDTSNTDKINKIAYDKEDAASTSSNEKLEDEKISLTPTKRKTRKRCATSESSSSEKSVSTKTNDSVKKVFKEPVNPCSSPVSKESTNAASTSFRKRHLRSPALNEKSRDASPAPPTKKYKPDTENKSGRSSRSTDTSENEQEAIESKASKPATKTDRNQEKTIKNAENRGSQNPKTLKPNEQKSKISESEKVCNQEQQEKDADNHANDKISTSSRESSTKKDDDIDNKSDILHESSKEGHMTPDNTSKPSKQVVTKEIESNTNKPSGFNKSKTEVTKKPSTEKEGTPAKFSKVDRSQKLLKVMVSKQPAQSATKNASTNKDKINKQPAEITKETTATTNKDDSSKSEESQQPSDKNDAQDSMRRARNLKLKRFTNTTEKDLDVIRKDSEKSSAYEGADSQQRTQESHKATTTSAAEAENRTEAVDKEVQKTVEKRTVTVTNKLASTKTKTEEVQSKNTKEQTAETWLKTSQQKESVVKEQHMAKPLREESTERTTATEKNLQNATRTPQNKEPHESSTQVKMSVVKEQHMTEPLRVESTERTAVTQKNLQIAARTPQNKEIHESSTKVKINETQKAAQEEGKVNVVQSARKTGRTKPTEETTTTSTKDVLKSEKQQHEEESKKNIEKQPENKRSENSQNKTAAAAVETRNKDSNTSFTSQKGSINVVKRRVVGKHIKIVENPEIKAGQQQQPKQQVKKVELVESQKEVTETDCKKADDSAKTASTNEKTIITVTKAASVVTSQKITGSLKNTQSAQPSKLKEDQELKEAGANRNKSETTKQPLSSTKDSRSALPSKAGVIQKKPQTSVPKEDQSVRKQPEETQSISSAKVTKIVPPPPKTKEGQVPKQAAGSQKKPTTTSQPESSTKEAKDQELKQASAASKNKPGGTPQTKQAPTVSQKQPTAIQPTSGAKEAKSVVAPEEQPEETQSISSAKVTKIVPPPPKTKEGQVPKQAAGSQKKPTTTSQPESSTKEAKDQELKQASAASKNKPGGTPQTKQAPTVSQKQPTAIQPTSGAKEAKSVVAQKATSTQRNSLVEKQRSSEKEDKTSVPTKDKEEEELNKVAENQKPDTTQIVSGKAAKEQEVKQISDSPKKKPQTTQQISSLTETKSEVPPKVSAEEKTVSTKTATTQKITQSTQPVSRPKEVKEPELQQTSDSSQNSELTQQLNSAKEDLVPKSTEQQELTRTVAASEEEKPKETKESSIAKEAKISEPPKAQEEVQELEQTPLPINQDSKLQEKPEDLQESAEEKHKATVVEKKSTTEGSVSTRKSLRSKVLAEKEEVKPTAEATKTTGTPAKTTETTLKTIETRATTQTPAPAETATITAATPTTEKIIHSHGTRKASKLRVAETPPPHAPTPTLPTTTHPTTSTSAPPQHIHGTRKATKAKLVQEHQTSSPANKPALTVAAQNTPAPGTPTTAQQKDLPADQTTKEVEPKKHEITPAVTRRSFKLQAAKSPEKQPESVASVRTYLGRSTETARKMLIQTPSQTAKSKSTGNLSFKEWKENQRKNKLQSNSNKVVESKTKTNETANEQRMDTSVELVLDVAVQKLTTVPNEAEALNLDTASKVSTELNIDLDTSADTKRQTQITPEHISEMVENFDNSVSTKLDVSKQLTNQLRTSAAATPSSEVENKSKKEVSNETENFKAIEENVQQILEKHLDTNSVEDIRMEIGIETNAPIAEVPEKITPNSATNSPTAKDAKSKESSQTSPSLPKKKRPKSELESLMESLPKFLESSIYLTKRRRRDVNSLSPTRTSPQANSSLFKTPTAPLVAKISSTTRIEPAINPFSDAGAIAPVKPTVARTESRTAQTFNKSYPLKVLDMSPVNVNPFATATVAAAAVKKADPIKMLPGNKLKADKRPEKLRKCRKVCVRINRSNFRKYQRTLLLKLRSKPTKPAQTHSQETAPILSIKSDDNLPSADIAAEEQIDSSLLKLCHTLNALSAPVSTMPACSSTPSASSTTPSSLALNKNLLEVVATYATTAEASVNSRTAIIDNESGHNLRSCSVVLNEIVMSPQRHPKSGDVCEPEKLQEQLNSSETVSAQEEDNERVSPNSQMLLGDDSLLTPLKSSTQASAMVRQQQQQQQQQQKRSARLQQQSTLKQQTATLQTQPQQLLTKPTSTQHHKQQHQHEQSIFTPIVPKKEFDEEPQTPAVHTTTSSGKLSTAPATSSLLSGGVPAAIVDNSGTRLYSFLHPSKYNRSHGAVLLDYCCPNLDGPMPAIDPTREHAQLQSLVRELPAYIVMTTKVVTRADLEAKNNSIPASIRKKMEKLTSVAGAASTAATAAAATNRTPTLQALIAKGPQAPPPPTHPIAATAVPTITTQIATPAPIYTSTLSALQKQLPATTTLTPKMPPMTLHESLPPLTPFSALSSAAHGGGAVASASRPPLKPEFMRAVLRANLRRFDTMLQKYSPRISELSYVDRQRIIDGIVHQTTLNSQDVEQATRLLDEYCQLANGIPVVKPSNTIATTPTVNTATPTTVSTTPTAYAATSANLSTSLTPTQAVAAQHLEQIHANAVQKVRTAGSTSVQGKRQVPIYDKDRNIIGYQMHNVPSSAVSSTNSTLSTRVGIMSSTRQRLSNPASGTPTSTLKQPPQESPRIFYTKPMQTSTPIANNNNSSASAAYEAASRLSRSVTIRQVPLKVTPQLNNSSPRMPTLSKMPMAGKPNTSSGNPRIATLPTSNPTTPNSVTTKSNLSMSSSTLTPTITKRITRHTATTREGQILVITKDKDGNVATGTPANDAESILPDEERSAAELKEIKREKDDDGFIGAS